MRNHQGKNASPRGGVVLLAVLVVVVVLTLIAYQYSELMFAEYKAADSYTRLAQSRALAESGVHFAAAALSNPDSFTITLNRNPYSAPAFQGVIVQPNDKPRLQGRFSIVSPLSPDEPVTDLQPFRFGVTDECGRINLNALMQLDKGGNIAHNVLMMLPNMTEEIANSILDWIDPDSDPRPGGAEDEYYMALTPPYHCKNGPLDSIEELLFVKGVTPQLLFGNDRNRNGILDADENDGSGILDRGWSAYLTIYSREQNLDSSGNPRIYVNDRDLNKLYDKLNAAVGPDLAGYIVAYRLYGPTQPNTTATFKASVTTDGNAQPTQLFVLDGAKPQSPQTTQRQIMSGSPDKTALGNLQGRSGRAIASLYELVNTWVALPGKNNVSMVYPSPLDGDSAIAQLLPALLDTVTTVKGTELPARININTAPQAVLATLPGLTDADVQAILDHRPNPSSPEAPDAIFQTPAWLITEANFEVQKVRTLDRYITARSQVYRVQSIGYFDGEGPTARIEAVIDTNNGRPRVVYWRDLTELGKGFNLQSRP